MSELLCGQETSFFEEAIIRFKRFSSNSPAYNINVVLKVCGNFDPIKFVLASEVLSHHYKFLGYSFLDNADGVTRRRFKKNIKPLIIKKEVSDNVELDAAIQAMVDSPFELSVPPLFRIGLIESKSSSYHLVFVAHHSILDFSSFCEVIKEIMSNYKKIVKNELLISDKGNDCYESYLSWFSQDLIRNEKELKAFWQEELKKVEVLNISGKLDKPIVPKFLGKNKCIKMDADLIKKVKSFSRTHRLTPFVVFLAVFEILMSRYSSQDKITIGIPVSVKKPSAFYNVIGNFANPVIFNFDVIQDKSFLGLLADLQEKLLVLYRYANYPFSLLLDSQSGARAPFYPFFSIMFSWSQSSFDFCDLEPEGVKIENIFSSSTGVCGAPYKLMLNIQSWKDTFLINWNYSCEHFSDYFISSMAENYHAILLELISEPHKQLSMCDLLSAQQYQVERYNLGSLHKKDALVTFNIIKEIERACVCSPEHIAIRYLEKSISYSQLLSRVFDVAQYFHASGLGRGDIVAVCIDRSDAFVVSILAVLEIGGVFLPIDTSLPEKRIHYFLQDSGATAVITDTNNLHSINLKKIKTIDFSKIKCHGVSHTTFLREISFDLNDPIYIIYTSGSTGDPKGAINTCEGLLNKLLWVRKYLNTHKEDVVLFKTSPGFDVSVCEYLLPLISGATLVIAAPRREHELDYLNELIIKYNVTIAHFVPSLLKLYLDGYGVSDVSSLKHIIASGEVLELDVVKKFYRTHKNCILHNFYGPTETAIDVTYWRCREDDSCVPIGFPIDSTRLYVLDKYLRCVPRGVIGELYIGGAPVGIGYINKPSQTAEKFLFDPFLPMEKIYKTGDLVYVNEEKQMLYVGRMDRQVKLHGFRVELNEVEYAINALEFIKETAVCVIRQGELKYLAAIIVQETDSVSTDGLRELLAYELPSYMLPTKIIFQDRLPRLASGKIDYKAIEGLFDQYEDDFSKEKGRFISTHNNIVIQGCQKILKVNEIRLRDNFFSIGGNSLAAVRLVSFLNKKLNINLSIKEFYQCSSLWKLDKLVKSKSTGLDDGKNINKIYGNKRVLLTPYQLQIYVGQCLDSNSTLYNINKIFLIKSQFNELLLVKTLTFLLKTHQVLRLRISEEEGRVFQEIDNDCGCKEYLEVVSNRVLDDPVILGALIQEEAETPFLFKGGKLFRVKVFIVNPCEWYISFTFHHTIADGVSIGVFLKDFSKRYSETQEVGSACAIDFREIAYYAPVGKVLKSRLHFWKTYLKKWPAQTELMPDHFNPEKNKAGETLFRVLDKNVLGKVKAFSIKQGVSENVVFLSIFISLLYRYTQKDEIAIGIPWANRKEEMFQDFFCCLVNALPFYSKIDPTDNFLKLVEKINKNIAQIMDVQDTPLTDILKSFSVQSDDFREIYKIVYVYLNKDENTLDLANVESEPVLLKQNSTKFNFTFYVIHTDKDSHLSVQYCKDLYDESTIEKFFSHYISFLELALARPEVLHVDLP